MIDIFSERVMANVTAGFMWAPPKSPSDHAMVATMKPIPSPVITACEKPPSLPQVRGKTHWMDTSMNVAKNSERMSLQNAPEETSSLMARMLHTGWRPMLRRWRHNSYVDTVDV